MKLLFLALAIGLAAATPLHRAAPIDPISHARYDAAAVLCVHLVKQWRALPSGRKMSVSDVKRELHDCYVSALPRA